MHMPAPIATNLYTVRDALVRDFAGGAEKIAQMGFVGIEVSDFPGTTPEQMAKLFKDLGLVITSAHLALPLGGQKSKVLDTMAALGCRRLVAACSANGPDDFTSTDDIRRVCDLFNESNAVASDNGLSFGVHNHWWEFQQVEGRSAYEVMLDHLDSTVFFEIDSLWATLGGGDPAGAVRKLGKRAPLLHLKDGFPNTYRFHADGPSIEGPPMAPLGDGIVDLPSVVQAGEGITEWLIVEQDFWAGDSLSDVEKSYNYLVKNGLARGNRG
jgi:sugar phosphate isomerase/epimerase